MEAGDKRVKTEAGDGLDRISALPCHLKELILECMDLKDAMRTSILSSDWRDCWIGMTRFSLNLKDMKLDENVDMAVFRKTIDKILLLHTGPIHSINFCFPKKGNCLDVSLSEWFLALSKKGIRSIVVDANNPRHQILLPHSLFQCGNLESLKLFSFKITPPPNFMGFNNLVELVINSCTIPSDRLGNLISHCPLLEYLSLAFSCTKYRDKPLVINAANLRTLLYTDDLLGTIILENVPRLSYASFMASYSGGMLYDRPCISWDFICSMSAINKLQFQVPLLGPALDRWPRSLPTRLENLNTLILLDLDACAEFDLRLVFCFIRSSPCLQVLKLEFGNTVTGLFPKSEKSIEDALELLKEELSEKCKLSNLSTIMFCRDTKTYWSRPEIMLVTVLLSRCSNLKSFRILPIDCDKPYTEDSIEQFPREFEELPNKDRLIYH